MEDQTPSTEHKAYKIKELRVYSSTEWLVENRKKYRQVYERSEISYIYAELSFHNKLFDKENWEIDIELRCYETKNVKKQICQLNFTKKVSKFDNIVYIREGWGNKKNGTFWKKGSYYWEAWIDGQKVAMKYFYIEDLGTIDSDKTVNPFVSLQSIKLYEGQFDDVNEDDRSYMTTFSGGDCRYIYAEIVLDNKVITDSWHCEVFVKFYNAARELKGQVVRLHQVKTGDDKIKLTGGWGSTTLGSWKDGAYCIEVVFMETLLGTVYFNVEDKFVPGVPEVYLPNGRTAGLYVTKPDPKAFEEVFAELNQLIGLSDIKQRVIEHAKYIEFLRIRKGKGFADGDNIDTHAVFMGNPGTGKTTVAKMMGQLYKQMGLLSKGHVVEVDRVDLVGEYIGQTAPKVKEVIERARGGVLFIDEAYALARANDDTKDFGREVVEILIKEMSNGKGDLAVIVAGYPKEMMHFVNSNPGLKSRFKHFFEFSDYLANELIEIAALVSNNKEVKFSQDAWQILQTIIIAAYRQRDRTFGNARYVNDVIEKAKINMAMRLMARKNPAKLSKSELSEIQLIDVLPLKNKKSKNLTDLPLDQELLDEAMTELDHLTGVESVKNQIKDLVQVVHYHRVTNKSVIAHFSFHTVFVGNPGTGKTTVARILSKIYKALGILERGHLVETDRQGLVAGFVGQTAIKTGERIDEALGGVLFIDEAYALTNFNGLQGDFGNEAVQTLLKRMEDQRGEFFLFVSGYPANMDVFLKANPGLSSRFDRTLVFDDYSPGQLLEIGLTMIANEGYKLDAKAHKALETAVADMHLKRDKFFGNARTIRKLILDIIHQQNIRIAGLPVKKSSSSNLKIKAVDVEIMTVNNEKELAPRKMIGFQSNG
jgi:SpoVK/Ycf46/Vps4 family AAA+-type ATPase